MDHIVVDIEIQRTIEETPGGWDSTDTLGVSCAVVYEFQHNTFRIFGPSAEEQEKLKARLMTADRVTGFNTWAFDFPVIWGLPGRERVTRLMLSSDDLLRRIWQAKGLDPDVFTDKHKGWGLDVVGMGTLGRGKTGYGGDAPRWFQSGQWGRLVDYCLQDVALTRDLCHFIDRYGYIIHPLHGMLRIASWG